MSAPHRFSSAIFLLDLRMAASLRLPEGMARHRGLADYLVWQLARRHWLSLALRLALQEFYSTALWSDAPHKLQRIPIGNVEIQLGSFYLHQCFIVKPCHVQTTAVMAFGQVLAYLAVNNNKQRLFPCKAANFIIAFVYCCGCQNLWVPFGETIKVEMRSIGKN